MSETTGWVKARRRWILLRSARNRVRFFVFETKATRAELSYLTKLGCVCRHSLIRTLRYVVFRALYGCFISLLTFNLLTFQPRNNSSLIVTRFAFSMDCYLSVADGFSEIEELSVTGGSFPAETVELGWGGGASEGMS